jgi:hypothetical protein
MMKNPRNVSEQETRMKISKWKTEIKMATFGQEICHRGGGKNMGGMYGEQTLDSQVDRFGC